MRADELRAALVVAELEERLVGAKADGAADASLKAELRYARWVARGGPAEEAQRLDEHAQQERQRELLLGEHPEVAEMLAPLPAPHTNRHIAELYARWLDEQEG